MDITKDGTTLTNYGKEFQIKCLSCMISDRAFLERIIDIISIDYLEVDSHRWIAKRAIDYFLKYKEVITMAVFKVEINSIADEVMKAAVLEQVKESYRHLSATDLPYVKAQFLEFCKNQKLESAILQSVNFLNNRDYDAIKRVVDDAMKAGMERNIGHDYDTDIDQRMSDAAREVIKTNWPIIDTHLDGGLGKGELAFVIANSGVGKSWVLAKLGMEALKQGKNVMHFTMELNEKYVGLRYDACFSGIAFQEIRKNVATVKDVLSKIPNRGKLVIKYFPIKTISASTLKSHVEQAQMVTGKKIDLLVVDYADLLRPMVLDRNSNLYTEGGAIYEELRGVAGELQIPCWSASQAGRGSHNEEVVGAENVADSYKKIMTGDVILSLARTTENKYAGTGNLHIVKNRFGPDGMTYPCSIDTSCGKIDVFDRTSVEGAELLKKTMESPENIKDVIRKRWQQTHNDTD